MQSCRSLHSLHPCLVLFSAVTLGLMGHCHKDRLFVGRCWLDSDIQADNTFPSLLEVQAVSPMRDSKCWQQGSPALWPRPSARKTLQPGLLQNDVSTGCDQHSRDRSEIHSPNGDKQFAGPQLTALRRDCSAPMARQGGHLSASQHPIFGGWGRGCSLRCSPWESPLGLPAVKLHGDSKTSHPTSHLWPQRLWAFLDLLQLLFQAAAVTADPMQAVPCPAALLHYITLAYFHPLSFPSYRFTTSGKFHLSFLTYK